MKYKVGQIIWVKLKNNNRQVNYIGPVKVARTTYTDVGIKHIYCTCPIAYSYGTVTFPAGKQFLVHENEIQSW